MSGPQDDPKQVLLQQLRYWQERKAEAEKQLRYADAVIPGLQDSLQRLEVLEQPSAPVDSLIAGPGQDDVEEEEEDSSPDDGLSPLSTVEDITVFVEALVVDGVLPSLFTHTDVSAGLAKVFGVKANRSTLRTALAFMARDGKHFVIHEQGKGRRATIYQKSG